MAFPGLQRLRATDAEPARQQAPRDTRCRPGPREYNGPCTSTVRFSAIASAERNALTRLHGLDTLRAVAIVIVILFHLYIQGVMPATLLPLAKIGWIGVDLFFVLSGFLIGSQLLRSYRAGERPSLREFYRRRAYRILPAFAVVLLLYLVLPLWREAPGLSAPWQYATFTWNLLLLGYPSHRAFSHVWSLCVEEHFYLVFPVLLRVMMRRPSVAKSVVVLGLLVVGGTALRWWLLRTLVVPSDDEQGLMMMRYLYYPTYSRLDGLVVGVGLAAARTFRGAWWERFEKRGDLLALCGLAVVLGALWLCAFDYPSPDRPLSLVLAFPLLACGFGLLVVAATCSRGWLARRIPGAGPVAALAFSLYLTHKSVAHAAHTLLPRLTAEADWHSLGIYAVACSAVATLLYLGVERPFLALRVRRDARRDRAAAVDREIRLDPAV